MFPFDLLKRFSLSENKLRSMYRLGVTAGLEQARRASGPLAQLPVTPLPALNLATEPVDDMPAQPPVEHPRRGALWRAYNNTHFPRRVVLTPLPAFERQIWEEAPTIVHPVTRPLPDVE